MRQPVQIALILTVVLLSGCRGSQSVISLEVLQPALLTYPENVNRIGYLNRAPRTLDSFENIKKDKLDENDLYMLDTFITNSIDLGFLEGKSNSNLAYLDSMYYMSARRKDTLTKRSYVKSEKVNEICSTFDLDALITHDFYYFKFDEDYIYNSVYGAYNTYHLLIQEGRWTVYVPEQEQALEVYTFLDTLYFTRTNMGDTIFRFPKPLEMLKDGSHLMGYAFGMRNKPIWSESARVVYIGYQKELRKARKHTDKGDWDKARFIWSQNLASEDSKLAAKSAHNMAVYYEIEDELEQALIYAKKAFATWPSPRIELYMQELEIRLKNKDDVYKQFRIQ